MSDEIEKHFKVNNLKPLRREGVSSRFWRIVDFGSIIVHVMSQETRNAYAFEKLWDKAHIVKSEKTKDEKIVKKSIKKVIGLKNKSKKN
ncbi:MAG: RsfS/YbeB/iojap family protein [Endomicrobium sp.]|nr:RsfS/YbeB/iojap family protein [Endomicrobium sp.]